MGYPYDEVEDSYEDTDFQRKMMKMSLKDLKQRNIMKNNSKQKKEEEKKQSEPNGPGQGHDEEEMMQVTIAK